jgi:KRAB domain-containing zinc finger protein
LSFSFRSGVCDICQRRFNTPKALANHGLVHGGEHTKVHKCELCPYKTRYKHGLKVHYYMHLGLRPHHCDLCTKAFR